MIRGFDRLVALVKGQVVEVGAPGVLIEMRAKSWFGKLWDARS
jgi:ABC-type multidrug transport system fused ATPase/permease subunit